MKQKLGIILLGGFLIVAVIPGLFRLAFRNRTVTSDVPTEIEAWIAGNAINLRTCEAGNGFEDMHSLRSVIGDAHIVSLGEATHGTREFFQLKHRVLEYLASEMDFSVFAMEATFPESLALNQYVLEGKGDPEKLLSDLYFWTWNTEEMLSMIKWMRKYNENAHPTKKLQFYGFDMQFPANAARYSYHYIRGADPDAYKPFFTALERLKNHNVKSDQPFSTSERQELAKQMDAVLNYFSQNKAQLVKATSETAWRLARHHARVAQQFVIGNGAPSSRDEFMAEKIRWIKGFTGGKLVLWAHNSHVRKTSSGYSKPMGTHLVKLYGNDMVVFGLLLHSGSFHARQYIRGKPLKVFVLPPGPEGNIESALSRARLNIAALDWRRLPTNGPTREWFSTPRPVRNIGALHRPEFSIEQITPEAYDALLFVKNTTATRLLSQPD